MNQSAVDEVNMQLILELLETSSSSDDEDIGVILEHFQNRISRPKVENYLETVHQYTDQEFRRNFRVTKSMFEKIKELFENSDFRSENKHGLPSTSAESQILQFLWFAGNKCVIRDVASRFHVAESTCHKICGIVMDFLNHIATEVIKFPRSEEEKRVIAGRFEDIGGFPGIIGAVDGSYIPIRTPAHKIRSTYVNRHDQTSITLQGICDSEKKFLDVFTGIPSKMHDSRIFSMSFIHEEVPAVCGDEWHLIGDAAYPLRKWFIVPYRDFGNLSPEEKNFNFKLSQSRVKIENTFGLLKGRFRQLQRTEFTSVKRISKFIMACCVLHNLCIINADEWNNAEGYFNDDNPEPSFCEEKNARADGEKKRNELCQKLWNVNQ